MTCFHMLWYYMLIFFLVKEHKYVVLVDSAINNVTGTCDISLEAYHIFSTVFKVAVLFLIGSSSFYYVFKNRPSS